MAYQGVRNCGASVDGEKEGDGPLADFVGLFQRVEQSVRLPPGFEGGKHEIPGQGH